MATRNSDKKGEVSASSKTIKGNAGNMKSSQDAKRGNSKSSPAGKGMENNKK
jgi:hypothetical protein